jgi:formylaminopyrimidine deformylase / aminopyrimidine aminohydrolase
MGITAQHLLNHYPEAWQAATVHPFLRQCQMGQIQPRQFNTWLVQDYWFVIDFTRMLARVIAIAPLEHLDVLLGGMVALKDELLWFQAKALERQLSLDAPRHTTCVNYCSYMAQLADAPYAVQATALWAIELAYNQGWQKPGSMAPPYDEFADRWGNHAFTAYVAELERQADEALAQASEAVQQQAETVFLDIARFEQAFWQMAYSATALT